MVLNKFYHKTFTILGQQDIYYYYYQGLLAYELQKYDDALMYMNKVLKINPCFTEAYYKLALIYDYYGEYKKAHFNAGQANQLAKKQANVEIYKATKKLRENMNKMALVSA